MEVKEATPGTGGLCRSTFLNLRFATFLKAKLGKEPGFDNEVMAEAIERFDKTVKRQFTMSAAADDTYTIPVGGLANNKTLGISRGRYQLKSGDLLTIFEPVIQEVIRLVQDQISSSTVPIRAVLLVGGFGASNYLKERLRSVIGAKIKIMQPPNAWLAVAQGAVMKGLALSAPEELTVVRIHDRKARKHYGCKMRVPYKEKIHSDLRGKRVWCGLRGYWKVETVEWFINQGKLPGRGANAK